MPHDDDSLMINSQMRAIYEKAIASLEDGSQFAEYTIIRLLGRGGMGAVYEARHVTLEEHYAIKVLPYEFTARQDAVQRFENEARVMAKLKHPNIVRVDDFRQTQGLYWLRMELARGDGSGAVSLQDLADRSGGAIGQMQLLELMDDVLGGMAFAHQKGVIHRDIKPANILLFPKSGGGLTAKVADYGLVKLLGEEFLRSRVTTSVRLSMGGQVPEDRKGTSTRALLGTWEYMAPEQQEGLPVDARSDVYSLGLMTYRLLTGEKLSMQSPSDIREELVDEWDDFCRKALFTKPERRYADAAAMLEAMRPIQAVIERREADRKRAEAEKARLAEEARQRELAKQAEARKRELAEQEEARRRELAEQQERRREEEVKREERYREQVTEARRLEEALKLEDALEIWNLLAVGFPDRQEATEQVLRLKKLITQRNAVRKRDEDERRRLEEQARLEKRRQEEMEKRKELQRQTVSKVESGRKNEIPLKNGSADPKQLASLDECSTHTAVRKRQMIGLLVAIGLCFLGFLWLMTGDSDSRIDLQVESQPTLWTEVSPIMTGEQTSGDEPIETSQEQISRLMLKAESYFNDNKLTSPAGENAMEMVHQILSIDSDNRDALVTQSRVAEKYASWGDEKASSGDWLSARKHYESSLSVNKDPVIKGKLEKAIANLSVTPTPKPTRIASIIPTRTPVPTPRTQTTGTNSTIHLDNSVTLDLVYIAGGSFLMGSPQGEKDRSDDEGPVHTVELDGFWIGKYEVTQAQYQAAMGTNPSHFEGLDRPVENVSWEDAMKFCRKVSHQTGRTVTLPTEAQWEYACRSGSQTSYCYGDSDKSLRSYAWYHLWIDGTSGGDTHPVGKKKANAWGLYDMHGNVWEWCLDWYGTYPSEKDRNPVGPRSGSYRIYRGGSRHDDAKYCRSAFRFRATPEGRSDYLGFRVVRTD